MFESLSMDDSAVPLISIKFRHQILDKEIGMRENDIAKMVLIYRVFKKTATFQMAFILFE